MSPLANPEPAERIVRPELKARNGGGRSAPPEQGGPSAAMKLGTTAEPWDFLCLIWPEEKWKEFTACTNMRGGGWE